ncbi:uncharacterized [Tachysurus ichikawai]
MGRQPDGDVSHAILPALISPDRSFSSASFPELNRDTDISLHVVSFTELTVAVAEHLMLIDKGRNSRRKRTRPNAPFESWTARLPSSYGGNFPFAWCQVTITKSYPAPLLKDLCSLFVGILREFLARERDVFSLHKQQVHTGTLSARPRCEPALFSLSAALSDLLGDWDAAGDDLVPNPRQGLRATISQGDKNIRERRRRRRRRRVKRNDIV